MTDRASERDRGVLKGALRDYLISLGGKPASIPTITEAVRPIAGERPSSSIRSSLQDTRYFERVERGVFRSVEVDKKPKK